MKKNQHKLDTTPYQPPNTVLSLLVFIIVILTTVQSERRWTSTYSQWEFALWELFDSQIRNMHQKFKNGWNF